MTDSSLLQGSIVGVASTPMTPDERIDFPALRTAHRSAMWMLERARSWFASTTGRGQRSRSKSMCFCIAPAVLCAEGRIPGDRRVGSPSTHAACELARAAADRAGRRHPLRDAELQPAQSFGLQRHFTAVPKRPITPVHPSMTYRTAPAWRFRKILIVEFECPSEHHWPEGRYGGHAFGQSGCCVLSGLSSRFSGGDDSTCLRLDGCRWCRP